MSGVEVTPSAGDIAKERTFTIANDISIPENITGFSFDNGLVRSFSAMVSLTYTTSSGDYYAEFDVKGLQKGSGWVINKTYIGDNMTDKFNMYINSSGQMQYTSSNNPDFTAGKLAFRATTTTV